MSNEIETVGKIADATKEVAKTSGKAIDSASGAGRFFNEVFGDLVVDGVGLLGDRLKFYRLDRAILLADKTQKRLEERGVATVQPVAPKVALPLIENATIEEDDDLHSLWANLLASALDGRGDHIERHFVSVLADLTAEDALTLAEMLDDWNKQRDRKLGKDRTLTYGQSVNGNYSHSSLSVANLHRLGLIAPAYVEFNTYEPPGHDSRYGDYGPFFDSVKAYGNLDAVTVTPFGEIFCKAVIR